MFDYRKRQKVLLRGLRRRGKIPFIVTSMTDTRYLTGFTGSDGLLLVNEGNIILGTDGRYTIQAEEEASSVELYIYEGKKNFFKKFMKKGSTLFFDRDNLPFATYRFLIDAGYNPLPIKSPIKRLREVKEREEIRRIERAAIIASTSFMSTLSSINEDTTENEAAAFLEYQMKKMGAEGTSFPSIVAYGEKTAHPHARPGNISVSESVLALFDFGCRFKGYCSDETVTVRKKMKGKEMQKIFDTVRWAMEGAYSVLGPGISCRDLDLKVRKIIDKKGYGPYFVHSTGHGVGLEVHESPYISRFSRGTLREGMVITLEPGIYMKGKGGVRLEDLVAITSEGYEKLTYLPKGEDLPFSP